MLFSLSVVSGVTSTLFLRNLGEPMSTWLLPMISAYCTVVWLLGWSVWFHTTDCLAGASFCESLPDWDTDRDSEHSKIWPVLPEMTQKAVSRLDYSKTLLKGFFKLRQQIIYIYIYIYIDIYIYIHIYIYFFFFLLLLFFFFSSLILP